MRCCGARADAAFLLCPRGADHNRPSGAVESAVGDTVAQIVDHHVDEGMYASAQRDIQLVGSCATLVVRGSACGE